MLRAACACGAVQLRLHPPLLFVSHCHCQTCRQTHAAAFVTWTAVKAVDVEGSLRSFESSPGVHRRFCPHCGTHVLFDQEGLDRRYVPVAALRDPLPLPADSHVSYEEHVDWIEGVERLPCTHAKSDTPLTWA